MKKDIFDRIMELPGLRILNPFYQKHKEILLYLFFGGCAFVISIGSFSILNVGFKVNELIANIISWILAVLFAFFTNRTWVFDSQTDSASAFGKQFLSFVSARIVTLIIEEAIIFVFITLMGLNSVGVKVVAQIVVIILNYIFSKLFVFRK